MFNANNFFNNDTLFTSPLTGVTTTVPKPRYRYSTLGATVGGPVWLPKEKLKDKLFFFYSFEDSQTLNPQALRQVTVPTAWSARVTSRSPLSRGHSGKPVPIFVRDSSKTGNYAPPPIRLPASTAMSFRRRASTRTARRSSTSTRCQMRRT